MKVVDRRDVAVLPTNFPDHNLISSIREFGLVIKDFGKSYVKRSHLLDDEKNILTKPERVLKPSLIWTHQKIIFPLIIILKILQLYLLLSLSGPQIVVFSQEDFM